MTDFTEIYLSYDKEEITDLGIKLEEKGIDYKVDSPESNLESTYGIQNSSPIKLLVLQEQKAKAIEILGITEAVSDVDMSEYSEDDLLEIILHEDEWHETMINTAKQELRKRNISYSKEDIEQYQSERIEKLKEGKPISKKVLGFAWILVIGGSLIGLAIAIGMVYSKTTSFNGKKYYYYDYRSRIHGAILSGIGIGCIAFQLYYVYYVLLN